MKIYLAGPIRGLTYEETTDWREDLRNELTPEDGFELLSPMRGKEYLKGIGPLVGQGADGGRSANGAYEAFPMSTSQGLFRRDIYDVAHCDAVLAYLAGAQAVSIGTVMEIQRAYDLGKYIVTVCEDGNIHDHAFVRQASSIFVPTLAYACHVLKVIANKAGT